MDNIETVKVVFLGDIEKSDIISLFVYNNNQHKETSLSAQFGTKTVNYNELGKSIKFDIWDTVGQEKYRSLSKIFYMDAQVIVFVYDITLRTSFESLKNYWYKEVKANVKGNPILAVIARGIEKYEYMQVNINEGKEFADEIGAIFKSVSMSSDRDISTLFDNIGKTYLIPGFNYNDAEKEYKERKEREYKERKEREYKERKEKERKKK